MVTDGRKITYDAFEFDQEPFSISVSVMRADGSNPRQLTRGAIDVEPVFSPDGTKIAFGRIIGDSPTEQLEAIYVINCDGSGLCEVVSPRAGLEHPDWSPDGPLITLKRRPEEPFRSRLRRHPVGSAERTRPPRPVPTDTEGAVLQGRMVPRWSQDARRL